MKKYLLSLISFSVLISAQAFSQPTTDFSGTWHITVKDFEGREIDNFFEATEACGSYSAAYSSYKDGTKSKYAIVYFDADDSGGVSFSGDLKIDGHYFEFSLKASSGTDLFVGNGEFYDSESEEYVDYEATMVQINNTTSWETLPVLLKYTSSPAEIVHNQSTYAAVSSEEGIFLKYGTSLEALCRRPATGGISYGQLPAVRMTFKGLTTDSYYSVAFDNPVILEKDVGNLVMTVRGTAKNVTDDRKEVIGTMSIYKK